MDQDTVESFFCSQIHWYHTNFSGSRYKDDIVIFCKVGTCCRSNNFSIWNIHVMWSLPSNFLISILGRWISFEIYPWLSPLLESNTLRIWLLMEACWTWTLSWVLWIILSLLRIFSSWAFMILVNFYNFLSNFCFILSTLCSIFCTLIFIFLCALVK